MAEVILCTAVIFVALYGFVEIIRNLIFRFYKQKDDRYFIMIIPQKGNPEDIEYTLRSCITRAKWMKKTRPEGIICLNCGLDEVSLRICESICADHEYLKIMTKEEFTSKILDKT